MERVSQHPVLPVAVVPIVLAIKAHHRGRQGVPLRHRSWEEAAVDSEEEVDPLAEEAPDPRLAVPGQLAVGTLLVETRNLRRQDRLVPI